MSKHKVLVYAASLIACAVLTVHAQSSTTRQIALVGTTSIPPITVGSGEVQGKVFDSRLTGADAGREFSSVAGPNPNLATGPGQGVAAVSAIIASANPELTLSFDGIRVRDSRFADGGQTFTVEPPDQGLCVGNGFVLETVNSALRVYDTSGNALAAVTSLNTFYGYPPARGSTGAFGPAIADPTCYYDPDTRRWFHLVTTSDRMGTTADFAGTNHLDLAVSQTSSPLGGWNIYKISSQNDGTEGTPDHNCLGGPCLADYPKLGADAHGIYITTNERGFFPYPHSFRGAQIYAISKRTLAAGLPIIAIIEFDTAEASQLLDGNPGYTVWPATTPGAAYATELGGTEYFLSSVAVFNNSGIAPSDDRLRIWALSNTQSLDTSGPVLTLQHGVIDVETYAVPPTSGQKSGNVPLADCLNDTTISTPFGLGCWRFVNPTHKPQGNAVENQYLDSSDSRMHQVVFANGKLWGALNTALKFESETQAGIAYFVIQPVISSGTVVGGVLKQGYLGLAGNNLTYPAVGVTSEGRGVIAFTLLGTDHYPSAAYATLDALAGAGDIHVVAEGRGPEDGIFVHHEPVSRPLRVDMGVELALRSPAM